MECHVRSYVAAQTYQTIPVVFEYWAVFHFAPYQILLSWEVYQSALWIVESSIKDHFIWLLGYKFSTWTDSQTILCLIRKISNSCLLVTPIFSRMLKRSVLWPLSNCLLNSCGVIPHLNGVDNNITVSCYWKFLSWLLKL